MSILDKDGLYFLPLGGSDKIGMNMYVYACNGKLIVVDCGYAFLNDDFPGMDLSFADPAFAFSLYCSIILASFVGLKNSSIQSACFLASNFPHFHRYDSLKSALYIHGMVISPSDSSRRRHMMSKLKCYNKVVTEVANKI